MDRLASPALRYVNCQLRAANTLVGCSKGLSARSKVPGQFFYAILWPATEYSVCLIVGLGKVFAKVHSPTTAWSYDHGWQTGSPVFDYRRNDYVFLCRRRKSRPHEECNHCDGSAASSG